MRLRAADGLTFEAEASRPWRVAWGDPDWLGPIGLAIDHGGALHAGPDASPSERSLAPRLCPASGADDFGAFDAAEIAWDGLPLPLATQVRAYPGRALLVFRVEACAPLASLATGRISRPSVAWPWLRPGQRQPGGVPAGTRGTGHQWTEFAFPTFSGDALDDFLLFPHRPRLVSPLWLHAPDGRTLLLGPLDAFHEQTIAVPRGASAEDSGVRCGWHGDLDRVHAGFASELALVAAPGPRAALESWGELLRERHRPQRMSRHADASVGRLSYWTDNGAAYWYRTEAGCDVSETLEAALASLREARLPVSAVELDSWFYPHEKSRSIGPEGPEHVPPSGMLSWEPRQDALPDGVEGLRQRLGAPPLVLHSRHISSASPYVKQHDCWIDGDRAHPKDPRFFEGWIAQAASWGAIAYEQDWLVEIFLGVRELREAPGRTRAWQETLDAAAAQHGLSLVWCMATPADFLQTLSLSRISAIRTSGDYRYLAGNAAHWVRFLYTNAFARALGLWPFKDVFLSRPEGEGWDGDVHAEAEALLSALSAGPVGLGDRAGHHDREIALRTCREDGILVKPDVPIAALDRSFRRDCFFEPEPLVAEAYSAQPAGRWIYLASFNAWREQRELRFRIELADLGDCAPEQPVMAFDWRRGECARLAPGDGLDLVLAPSDWDLRVLCPILAGGIAVFGDVSKYASAGDRRLADVRSREGGVAFEVCGAPGERVCIDGWSERPLGGADVTRDAASGRWSLTLDVPASGRTRVALR